MNAAAIEVLEMRVLLSSTVVVNSLLDNVNDANVTGSTVTLREAVNYENANGGGTIHFASSLAGGTITLGTELELSTSSPITIDASSIGGITLSGSESRIFQVDSGANVTLDDLTITSGNGDGSTDSGAGGGIYNAGTLTISASTITLNKSEGAGGGVFSSGTLTVTASTFSQDVAQGSGGGIYVSGGVLTVANSTFYGDEAGGQGGGIFVSSGNSTVTYSTFYLDSGDVAGPSTLIDSIAADSLSGAISSASSDNLLLSGESGGLTATNGNILASSTAAMDLGALGNYGGPTETIPLLPGSPAIGAGVAVPGITTDQTGAARPATGVDIGASQSDYSSLASLSPTSGPANGGSIETLTPQAGSTFNLTGNWSVTMGGVTVPTSSATSSRITFALPAMASLISAGATVSTAIPVAFNPGDGTTSGGAFFSYNAPLLIAASQTPIAYIGGTSIELTGNNFDVGNGGSVVVGGVTLASSSIESASPTVIVFAAPAFSGFSGALSANGVATVPVEVINPDGQISSSVTLSYQVPVITAVTGGVNVGGTTEVSSAGGENITVTSITGSSRDIVASGSIELTVDGTVVTVIDALSNPADASSQFSFLMPSTVAEVGAGTGVAWLTYQNTSGTSNAVPIYIGGIPSGNTPVVDVVNTATNAPSFTSNFGYGVTLTASLAAGAAATGTIQFLDNGVDVGSPVTLSGGAAWLVTNTLPAGSDTLTAEYTSTGTLSSATSAGFPWSVVYNPTIVTAPGSYSSTGYDDDTAVLTSPGYVQPQSGQTSEDLANVGTYAPGFGNAAGIPAPSGYYVSTPGAIAPSPDPAGTYSMAGLNNGQGPIQPQNDSPGTVSPAASPTFTTLPTITLATGAPPASEAISAFGLSGTVYFTAGQSITSSTSMQFLAVTFVPSSDTSEIELGTIGVIAQAAPQLSLSASNYSPTYGTGATLTATVTGNAGLTPTGSVTFNENGNSFTTVTLSGTGSVATAAVSLTTLLTAGNDSFTFSYTGDSNYAGGSSGTAAITVAPAPLTLTALDESSAYGSPLQTLAYTANGLQYDQVLSSIFAPVPNASTNATPYATGSFPITFSPGVEVAPANYEVAYINGIYTVSPAAPDILLSSSAPSGGNFGQTLTFTASVAGVAGGTVPTGMIQFEVNGQNVGSPIPLATSGASAQATLTTNTLAAPTDTVTAEYSGDNNYTVGYQSLDQTVSYSPSTPTLPGSYSPSGDDGPNAQLAQPGYYVSSPGQTTETPDPSGTVSPAGATTYTTLPTLTLASGVLPTSEAISGNGLDGTVYFTSAGTTLAQSTNTQYTGVTYVPASDSSLVYRGTIGVDVPPAGSLVVTSTDDNSNPAGYLSNDNSLRDAIAYAESIGGGTITFAPSLAGQTINLTSGEQLELTATTDPIVIDATAINGITLSGNDATRVFQVDSGATVTLDDLTIVDGNAPDGGGISNEGTLTIAGSTFSADTAGAVGGALYSSAGTVAITSSTFSDDSSSEYGGAVAIDAGVATIAGSTISNDTAAGGGGIYNGSSSATLTVTASTLSNDRAGVGGGISNDGTLTITASTLSGDTGGAGAGGIFNAGNSTLTITASTLSDDTGANGGGISNNGGATLAITDSTLSDDHASNDGGGIFNNGPLTITASTLSDDGATGSGGGIYNLDSLAITACTLSGDDATGSGGGIDSNGRVAITDSTLSGDQATLGGGIYVNSGDHVTLTNSVIANSTGGDILNAGGTLTGSNDLIDDSSNLGGITDSITDQNALLGALGNYGGPTATIPLLPGSPAIGAGTPIAGVTTDQRGSARSATAPDIGAFESGGFTITPIAADANQNAIPGAAFADPLGVTVTANNPLEPVAGGVITYIVNSGASGASATLSSLTATIAADGTAGVNPALTATANSIGGQYTVSAGGTGIASPAVFSLYNDTSISGTVFNDLNGDGIAEAGEPGLAGVQMDLSYMGVQIATATTNSQGQYSFFLPFPAGNYAVQVQAPGAFFATTPAVYQFNLTNGSSENVPSIGLYAPVTVSGNVFLDSNDDGVQDNGEPGIAGATVELLNGSNSVIATRTTNASGAYSFIDVGPGNFSVVEVVPAGYTQTGPTPVPPGSYSFAAISGTNVTGDSFGNIPAVPSVSLQSSQGNAIFGTAVEFTAAVDIGNVPVTVGSVTFSEGATILASNVPLNASGQATFATSSLSASSAPQTITATYNPVAPYQAGSGTFAETVKPATPKLTVADAGGTYSGSAYAATATLTSVTGSSATTLEGVSPTVTYYTGTSATGASTTVAPTAAGTYTVVATFPGSTDYTTASSAPDTFVIGKATPIVTASDAGGVYTGSAYAATGTVTAPGLSTTPTSFTYAGTGSTSYNSTAAPTAAGTYTVTASYTGAGNYNSASSTATPFTISAASTSVGLQSSLSGGSYYGESVTLTATVSVVAPGKGTPLGSIEFYSNGTSLGTVALTGTTATLATTSLSIGGDTITATYLPSSTNFATSTNSTGITQDVNVGLLLLNATGSGALTVSGAAKVVATGSSVVVDSSSSTAINVSGSASISDSLTDAVGKASITGAGKVSALATGQKSVADPFASLATPTTAGLTTRSTSTDSIAGSSVVTLQPGIYIGGITVGGAAKVTLAPGEYYLEGGGFNVGGSGVVTGTGVFIYDAPTKSSDQFTVSGAAKLTLSPMTTGTWAGITIFQARTATNAIDISGSGAVDVTGDVYAADATVDISGAASVDTFGDSLIAYDLIDSGSGELVV